jgi:DNA (cytosine-5)-methyltransferase 1
MSAYYNENDPYCAQWLKHLVAAGHIAPGDIDDRDIRDVDPDDLLPYTQCHFFAGVGLWSLALRWAGWPDDRPVWTGSCPCQPFSAAGRGDGFADERHLWPAWEWLIGIRKPVAILGEQVGGPAGLLWLDLVCTDLEGLGYRCGAVDLPSASVGAPNIRQRLWWMADTHRTRRTTRRETTETLGYRDTAIPDGSWDHLDWIDCLDGKSRPTQPGLFPLATRHPGDVARLRAYGNAINPVLAAEFVKAWMECEPF